MISDRWDRAYAEGQKEGEKKNVAGIRFRQLSPAPTTEPNRLRRTPKTTLLDCCAKAAINACNARQSRVPSELEGRKSVSCATRGGLCAELQCRRSNFQTRLLQILLRASFQPAFSDQENQQSMQVD